MKVNFKLLFFSIITLQASVISVTYYFKNYKFNQATNALIPQIPSTSLLRLYNKDSLLDYSKAVSAWQDLSALKTNTLVESFNNHLKALANSVRFYELKDELTGLYAKANPTNTTAELNILEQRINWFFKHTVEDLAISLREDLAAIEEMSTKETANIENLKMIQLKYMEMINLTMNLIDLKKQQQAVAEFVTNENGRLAQEQNIKNKELNQFNFYSNVAFIMMSLILGISHFVTRRKDKVRYEALIDDLFNQLQTQNDQALVKDRKVKVVRNVELSN